MHNWQALQRPCKRRKKSWPEKCFRKRVTRHHFSQQENLKVTHDCNLKPNICVSNRPCAGCVASSCWGKSKPRGVWKKWVIPAGRRSSCLILPSIDSFSWTHLIQRRRLLQLLLVSTGTSVHHQIQYKVRVQMRIRSESDVWGCLRPLHSLHEGVSGCLA